MYDQVLRQCFAGLMGLERQSAALRTAIRTALSSTPVTAAKPSPNGHNRSGPILPNRLTTAEAKELGEYLEDSEAADVRDELGMTLELAQKAAARQDLAPEIIARVQRFLATGEAG